MTINDYLEKANELSNAQPNECYSKTVQWITCKTEKFKLGYFRIRRTQSVLSLELVDCNRRGCRLRSVIKKERFTTIEQNADFNVHFREVGHKEGMSLILWRYAPDMPTSLPPLPPYDVIRNSPQSATRAKSKPSHVISCLFRIQVVGEPGQSTTIFSNYSRGRLFIFSHQKEAIIRGRRLFRIFLSEMGSWRRSCPKYVRVID